jgi:NADH:ubiquinone oxidoreductase subunit H
VRRIAFIALVAATAACNKAPELDGIRDVRPTSVEVGEKLLIETNPERPLLAVGAPVKVTLKGWTEIPGKPRNEAWSMTVPGRATAPAGQTGSNRVLVDADAPLHDELGGHVKFTGVMTVEGTDLNGQPATFTSGPGLRLEFFPRSVRRLAYGLVGGKERSDLFSWLGVEVADAKDGKGVRVELARDELKGLEFISGYDCGIWDAQLPGPNKCRAPHDGKVSRDEALAAGITQKQFDDLDTGTGQGTLRVILVLGGLVLLVALLLLVAKRFQASAILGVVAIATVLLVVRALGNTGERDGYVTRDEAVSHERGRSPAAVAGLQEGDVIVAAMLKPGKFDVGPDQKPRCEPADSCREIKTVDGLAQTWISEGEPTITLGILRTSQAGTAPATVAPATIELPRYGKPASIPSGFLLGGILFAVGLLVILPVPIIGGLIVVWERKIAGRMQSRPGPNRVGPGGWLQFLADGIKLIVKEDLIPKEADPYLFRVSPYLVFIGVFATFVVLPFSQSIIVADLNVGILYLLSVTSLVVVGIIMGGWASNSKWSLLGGMRSAAQIISYELPASIAVLSVVTLSGTLSTQGLVLDQGGPPWRWHLFDNPFTFACFFIYFISALAEGNRTPFDLPEAESELVAGYNTEYSGFRFSIYFLAEWVNLIVIGAVATTVFLGGWRIPFISPASMEANGWLQLAAAGVFCFKVFLLIFVIIWVRWTLPRFRVDQMMNMCWKYFLPISLVSFLGTAAWVVIAPRGSWLRLGMQLAMFAVFGVGTFIYFMSRVMFVRRTTKVMDLRGA